MQCVTIFSTGGKFCSVSIFTQLHALTLVACSYALLVEGLGCKAGLEMCMHHLVWLGDVHASLSVLAL